MNWLTIVQNIATFITGQFGIALVTVAIGIFGSPLGDLSSVGQFRGSPFQFPADEDAVR
jgi:hypothetical protein